MGYYTNYSLEVMPHSDAVIEKFRNDNEHAAYALDESGDSNEGTKWYDHNEDLTKLSKEFPNHIFLLEGKGEESGDIWKTYYKNGKLQECKAKMVFPEPTDPFIETQEQEAAALKDEIAMVEKEEREAADEATRLKREKIDSLKAQLEKLENE